MAQKTQCKNAKTSELSLVKFKRGFYVYTILVLFCPMKGQLALATATVKTKQESCACPFCSKSY